MYRIFGLSVEVTRRCNFYCAHCLRGEPQDIDLDIDAFRCFVKENVQSIGTISLTGGEPTLALDQCEAVLRVLQEEDIPFDSRNSLTRRITLNSLFDLDMRPPFENYITTYHE